MPATPFVIPSKTPIGLGRIGEGVPPQADDEPFLCRKDGAGFQLLAFNVDRPISESALPALSDLYYPRSPMKTQL